MRSWKIATTAIILVAIILVATFLTVNWATQKLKPKFYVGVEFAYAYDNKTSMESFVGELKQLVDKVKDYTNLFVIGTPDITFNQTALNESCDYITKAGLSFIVLFTDQTKYDANNNPFTWIQQAPQKYGDKFLAVYRFDEPGGNQLDHPPTRMVTPDFINISEANYANAASLYEYDYQLHLAAWQLGEKILTADYGLYWFDYKSGFDTILTEFGSNQSRQLAIGLCRGAANAQGKDWGAIVTWTYNQIPYIESGNQLYSDLKLAFDAGAKYAVIFDYPKNASQYGVLQPEHFDALRNFWNYVQNNPQKHGSEKGQVAYMLPPDYGFGFRRPDDTIWGLFPANETMSTKLLNDLNTLIGRYGTALDAVYDDPQFNNATASKYTQLYFWNQTIT